MIEKKQLRHKLTELGETMTRLRFGTIVACLMSGMLLGCPAPKPPQKFPELPLEFWKPLTVTFERQARGLSDAQWKGILEKHIVGTKSPVTVAVVDAVPADLFAPLRSVHSFAVQRVIGSLFCEDSTRRECRVRLNAVSETAAPAAAGGTRDREAPNMLTLEQLAKVLRNILDQWRPGNGHLIINVSVAWDPVKTDPGEANIQSVVQQLKRASCLGGIVIAPAGNVTGTIGPMFPAIFEGERAPTAEECARTGFPGSQTPGGAYAPLVYAVGSLDARDQRLETMRQGGQPRLAAYGLAVSAPLPNNGYTPPLSGTSMSAAIVSGIAAAVWSARPELTGHQIMDLVYQGGVPLDGGYESNRARTDFCEGQSFGPCRDWTVHRAFLCGALAKALPNEQLPCVLTPSRTSGLSTQPPFPPPATATRVTERCRVLGCGGPTGPLAVQKPEGALPQPTDPTCPTCNLTRDRMWGTLIWPDGPPSTMVRVTLETFASARSTTPTAVYTMPLWTPTDAYFFFWMNPPEGTRAATLSVTDGYGLHVIPVIVPLP